MDEKRRLGREIRILSNMMRREIDSSETLRCTRKVTGTGGWLLGYLYANRDIDVYQRDIEKEFQIRRATSSKVVSRMEEKGLVRRETVSSDARLKKLTLTDAGLALQREICSNLDSFDEKFTAGLSEKELDAFYSVIDRIKENIEK